MKSQSRMSILFLAMILVTQTVFAREPDSPEYFPKPGKDWMSVQYDDSKSSVPWHYDVFVNSKTGDLLSFAAHRLKPNGPRELIKWSDSAREIFPIGHPVWIASSKTSGTSHTIRNDVKEIRYFDSKKNQMLSHATLQYSLVIEVRDGKNRMVHGYAFTVKDVVYFVQHTSMTPITSELAQTTAKELMTKCHAGKFEPFQQQ